MNACSLLRSLLRSIRRLLACGLFACLWWAGSAHAIDCTVTMSDIECGDAQRAGHHASQCQWRSEGRVHRHDDQVRPCLPELRFAGRRHGGESDDGRPNRHALSYNIYQNASHTTPWGSVYLAPAQPRSVTMQADAFGMATATVTYYGYMLQPQPAVPAGSYAAIYTTADTNMNVQGYVSTPPACSTSMPQGTRLGLHRARDGDLGLQHHGDQYRFYGSDRPHQRTSVGQRQHRRDVLGGHRLLRSRSTTARRREPPQARAR